MTTPARKCDRCGFTEGNVRSGKMQPETLTYLTQGRLAYLTQGRLDLLLCGKCRATLAKLKPIPRA